MVDKLRGSRPARQAIAGARRITSARRSNRRERKAYDQAFADR